MKANPFHVAVLYALDGLISGLWGQKLSTVNIDRLSPSQLVKLVTYQNRPDEFDPVLECAPTSPAHKRDEAAIERLVSLGDRSVPAIEAEFDAISKKGSEAQYSKNYWRLIYAYARILGPRAFPRLREMELSQHWSFATSSLESAIARALGLTSYRSIAHPSLRVLWVCGGQQPRQALDQMIGAWERGDRLWFETSLGENAARAIAVKDDEEWQVFRKTLWRDDPHAAVGYKFEVSNQTPVPNEEEKFDIETVFYNQYGRNCGHIMMKFVHNRNSEPGYIRYAVDNANITEVLQLISACAGQ